MIESMARNYKLTIELVPSTSFFSNVRAVVSQNQWDAIRKTCYKKANYKCEICGNIGQQHPVECHEIWKYTSDHKQVLKGFIALCPSCHMVKHIGFAKVRGLYDEAINHLAKVNNISNKEARNYTNECFLIWENRSQYQWKLDISLIKS
jgi:5-methylcytosine-specific restriction endonuclease McrA